MMAKYINADKADVRNIHSSYMGYSSWADVLEWLQNQPAADVMEIKHGEWKLHPDGSGTCSVCGKLQNHIWDLDNWQNFCGHCGADLRGEINNVE